MTQQYTQRNINQEGDGVFFTATVATPNITLQPSSQTIAVDTALTVSTVTLPRLSDVGLNTTITIVKTAAANTLTVAAAAGDTLGASAAVANPLVGANDTMTVRSGPTATGLRWIVTSTTV